MYERNIMQCIPRIFFFIKHFLKPTQEPMGKPVLSHSPVYSFFPLPWPRVHFCNGLWCFYFLLIIISSWRNSSSPVCSGCSIHVLLQTNCIHTSEPKKGPSPKIQFLVFTLGEHLIQDLSLQLKQKTSKSQLFGRETEIILFCTIPAGLFSKNLSRMLS